jgi:hypothetical protein
LSINNADQVKSQIFRLQPRLKAVISDLAKLKSEIESGRSSGDVEKGRKELQDRADTLKDEIEGALMQFTNRIASTNSLEWNEAPASLSDRPLHFCQGAILCQSGKADARKLSVPGPKDSPQRWGFVCTYCFLEVADYSAVRFSRTGEPVVHSDMLAASHVMACASFNNRRAYYKCLACYENHEDVDFSSAQAFEKHMQSHPGYSFIKNEAEAFEETRKNIRYYVLEPKPETLSVYDADDDADGNYDEPGSQDGGNPADVSPVSSPELAVRGLADNPVGPDLRRQRHVSSKDTTSTTRLALAQDQPLGPTQSTKPPGAPSDNHPLPLATELPVGQQFATWFDPVEMAADSFGAQESGFYASTTTTAQDQRLGQQQRQGYGGGPSELQGEAYQDMSEYHTARQTLNINNHASYPRGISTSAPATIRPGTGERTPSRESTVPDNAPPPTPPTPYRMAAPQYSAPSPPIDPPYYEHPTYRQPAAQPHDPTQSSSSSQQSGRKALRDRFRK